jgi:hypothetical protein
MSVQLAYRTSHSSNVSGLSIDSYVHPQFSVAILMVISDIAANILNHTRRPKTMQTRPWLLPHTYARNLVKIYLLKCGQALITVLADTFVIGQPPEPAIVPDREDQNRPIVPAIDPNICTRLARRLVRDTISAFWCM